MRVLITGVAGFVGSSIAAALFKQGHDIVGVDAFVNTYAQSVKDHNLQWLESLAGTGAFKFVNTDLSTADLNALLDDIGVIFHQAGLAGIRESWGKEFELYTNNNILVTQKLLEASVGKPLQRFVFASSSSVYGEHGHEALSEQTLPQPLSPYGVSKLSAEQLCHLYWHNFQVPCISLRYFTVYGPRQRPGMAFHDFICAIYKGDKIKVYGDGNQTRDFTYVDDIVAANLACIERGQAGQAYNIGGGDNVTVNQVIDVMQDVIGKKASVDYLEWAKGDVMNTWADCSKAQRDLGYKPGTGLEEGIRQQAQWIKDFYKF